MSTTIIFLYCLLIFVLIIMSGFLSGTETAMTASSKARLIRWHKSGHKKSKVALDLLENTESLIGALLIGNNFVNILASALATSLFLQLFGDAGVAMATFTMTLLLVIFAEVLPKVYALANADKVATVMAPIIRVLVFCVGPLNFLVRMIVVFLLSIAGAKTNEKDNPDSQEEELLGAIDLHTGDDPDYQHEREMLRSVMDLDDTTATEAFTHRKNVISIDINTPVNDMLEIILKTTYSKFPITNGTENIIGVLHEKDFLNAYFKSKKNNKTLKIRKVMRKTWFIPENTSMLDQLQAFRDRAEHFCIIVDEYGSYMGVLTMTDILEHIVGDIKSENEENIVRKLSDESYLFDGDELIRNINRELDWDLSDEDASTLAGYIIHNAQTLPEQGHVFHFDGYDFIIAQRQKYQITKVRVRKIKQTEL